MIKNIILDVGKVLIAWDPERAFRKMGLGEAEAKAVADATINTPIWTETDRGVWPAEKILNAFYKAAPQYENEVSAWLLPVLFSQWKEYWIFWKRWLLLPRACI